MATRTTRTKAPAKPRARKPPGLGAPEPDDHGELDLRDLAEPTRPVLTSAGRLRMRRFSGMGTLDRARVLVLQGAAEKAADGLTRAKPAGLQRAADAYLRAEGDLLRCVLIDVTDEQLDAISQPERTGILVAFFGATAEVARAAVQVVAARLDGLSPSPSPSPASSGSTAATRRRG